MSTKERIIKILKETAKPVSLPDLKKIIKDSHESTIFRNLISLEKKGEIKVIRISTKKTMYELSSLPHHHHITCLSCEKTEDIHSCFSKKETTAILKKTKFKSISDHSLEFFGICNNCAKI